MCNHFGQDGRPQPDSLCVPGLSTTIAAFLCGARDFCSSCPSKTSTVKWCSHRSGDVRLAREGSSTLLTSVVADGAADVFSSQILVASDI